MSSNSTEDQLYEEARRRVKEKKDFYNGLATYLIVNGVLVIIWALSGQGHRWFLWPLGIWGVFVLGDFIKIFVIGQRSDHEAVEKEAEKIRRER